MRLRHDHFERVRPHGAGEIPRRWRIVYRDAGAVCPVDEAIGRGDRFRLVCQLRRRRRVERGSLRGVIAGHAHRRRIRRRLGLAMQGENLRTFRA
jgi:hypothetical protein